MARSTLAKAFGLRRGPLSDTTWQPLPRSMLKLLVEIADAECGRARASVMDVRHRSRHFQLRDRDRTLGGSGRILTHVAVPQLPPDGIVVLS